jgi:uncharacterized OsmC-like protein
MSVTTRLKGAIDLRATQKPLKERYRAEPEAAIFTLKAEAGTGDDVVSCSVDLGRAIQQAQAHEGVGGAGTAACSGDLLLGALAACAQLTCQMVATAMGLDAQVKVVVEGDVDLKGTLGLDREVNAGFREIRTRFEVDAPEASEEELESLISKTERYCTVLQSLKAPSPVSVELVDASS